MTDPAMVDPGRAGDMDALVERYGEVQGRFEELDDYALEARAREVLHGLGFEDPVVDGAVEALLHRADVEQRQRGIDAGECLIEFRSCLIA